MQIFILMTLLKDLTHLMVYLIVHINIHIHIKHIVHIALEKVCFLNIAFLSVIIVFSINGSETSL